MFGAAPPTSSNYVSSYFISTSHFLTSPEVEHCFISNTHIILISTYNIKDLANIRRCATWTHLTFLGKCKECHHQYIMIGLGSDKKQDKRQKILQENSYQARHFVGPLSVLIYIGSKPVQYNTARYDAWQNIDFQYSEFLPAGLHG